MSRSRTKTVYLTKDGVEYELEVELEGSTVIFLQVVVISGGISRPETEIDPDEFQNKMTQNDWSYINDALWPTE